MKLISWIVAICIFLTVFNLIILDTDFQTFLINHHSNSENAEAEHLQVLEFFKTGTLNSPMTDAEKSHMEDVRVLYHNFIILSLLFILITGYIYYKKRPKINFNPIIKTTAVIGIISAVFANDLFNLFHKVFFPQGNYTFAVDSFLITLYPASYFFSLFFWAIGLTVLICIMLEITKRRIIVNR